MVELECGARHSARDGLDAGGDVRVALARLDRVEGHPRGLQRGGAEAVDGRRGHVVVDAREQPGDAPDVVALLALAEAAAHHDVDDRARVELGVALDQLAQRDRGEVVRADALQRSLPRSSDGGANGVDDHCFRHLRRSPWSLAHPRRGRGRSAYAVVAPQRDEIAAEILARATHLALEASAQRLLSAASGCR